MAFENVETDPDPTPGADSYSEFDGSAEVPLLVGVDGGVGTVLMNRPEARNALNAPLCEALVAGLRKLDHDPQVRAVVLGGNGKAFCAGADLREFAVKDPVRENHRAELAAELTSLVSLMKKPVIAAVAGPALAGGCGLAMSCDAVVAAEDAFFGYPELSRGLVPAGTLVGLEELVGRRRAFDLVTTGRRISAVEAMTFGMVTQVVPAGTALERATERAHGLAEISPTAMGNTKELLNAVADMPRSAKLRHAALVHLLMRSAPTARTAMDSFQSARSEGAEGAS